VLFALCRFSPVTILPSTTRKSSQTPADQISIVVVLVGEFNEVIAQEKTYMLHRISSPIKRLSPASDRLHDVRVLFCFCSETRELSPVIIYFPVAGWIIPGNIAAPWQLTERISLVTAKNIREYDNKHTQQTKHPLVPRYL
jgi:hypothetical protein